MEEERIFYTVKECAEKLRVHENSIRKWVKLGTIRGVKIQARLLIPVSEVIRLERGETT